MIALSLSAHSVVPGVCNLMTCTQLMRTASISACATCVQTMHHVQEIIKQYQGGALEEKPGRCVQAIMLHSRQR